MSTRQPNGLFPRQIHCSQRYNRFPLLQLTALQVRDPVAELDEDQPITVLKKHPQTL